MSRDFQRIAIVGSGAVGLYYGARLANAGEDVNFLLRSDYDTILRDGIRVESVHGDFSQTNVCGWRTPEQIGPVDLVIVAWKATANRHLSDVLPPLLHAGSQVLTLQNGLGNCEKIAEITGAERVLGGLCFVCINRLSPGHVRHSGGGRISIGEWRADHCGRAKSFATRFQEAGIHAFAVEQLERAQWEKLVWNIPFNGLSIAEGGVSTDVLLASEGTREEIRALMAEVINAGRALGHDLESSLIENNINRTYPMGAYRPSSMIDFLEGREVELAPIWEEPLRQARAAGVEMTRTDRLLGRIKEKLAGRDSIFRPA
jgi:2-dehydropantoate 2-reductase